LEAELFGYERGAFTGAVARSKGKFELAHGGTLFLDEIGDISPKLQLDLLRVLEERHFYRLGGTMAVAVDVRIIAATNRDIKRAVEDGAFRDDLYYRLNVIPVTVPPLRERREDIPLLIGHFLEQLSTETGRHVESVSTEAMGLLMAHGWPGNVRELRNVLERAVVVAPGPILQVSDLGLTPSITAKADVADAPGSLEGMERRHISEVLEHTGGNVSEAARILDIDRATLYSKIRKYQLKKEEEAH
jgi:transcriptional regulator with PAS, ATPase and Fis domain